MLRIHPLLHVKPVNIHEAEETYRSVYRSVYPFLTNGQRRAFASIRVHEGPRAALSWLYRQEIAWGDPRVPEDTHKTRPRKK